MTASDLNRLLEQLQSRDPALAREVEWQSTAGALASHFLGGSQEDVLLARQQVFANFGLCPPPLISAQHAVALGHRALAGEPGQCEGQIQRVLFPLTL